LLTKFYKQATFKVKCCKDWHW